MTHDLRYYAVHPWQPSSKWRVVQPVVGRMSKLVAEYNTERAAMEHIDTGNPVPPHRDTLLHDAYGRMNMAPEHEFPSFTVGPVRPVRTPQSVTGLPHHERTAYVPPSHRIGPPIILGDTPMHDKITPPPVCMVKHTGDTMTCLPCRLQYDYGDDDAPRCPMRVAHEAKYNPDNRGSMVRHLNWVFWFALCTFVVGIGFILGGFARG